MKIVYDIDPESVIRVDGLIIDVSEFTATWSGGLVFRGDDREPKDIFDKGFSKRDGNRMVATTRVLDIDAQPSLANDEVFRDERPSNAKRTTQYRLGPGEVLLRTQHLDLEQATCVSSTRDPSLATGFPLGGKSYTYLYVMHAKQKRLDTHEIQALGGRDGLAKSLEVTFNQFPPTDVVGAARVQRTVTGIDAMSSVAFEIDAWFVNDRGVPVAGELKDLLALARKSSPQFELKGTKLVGGGAKDENSKADSDELLFAAIQATKRVAAIHNSGRLDGLTKPGSGAKAVVTPVRKRAGSLGSKSDKKGDLPKWL